MSFMDGRAFIMALEGRVRFTQAKLRDSRLRKQTEKQHLARQTWQIMQISFVVNSVIFAFRFLGLLFYQLVDPLSALVHKCHLLPSPPCPHHTLGDKSLTDKRPENPDSICSPHYYSLIEHLLCPLGSMSLKRSNSFIVFMQCIAV